MKKINEGEGYNDSYVLEGVFAELDVLNRNQRIYPKDEYLKHLTYLRKDIESGEPLLGELDHPDDRFETKLQNVSHEVIDLYYDESSNCVMGKIKLLDTPCGKIAKAMVDEGVPLHISSRSAGEVDDTSHKVKIYQVYTYDLVAKPGFASAVLHRVNESDSKKYDGSVIGAFRQMERTASLNIAPQYGIVNENVEINEVFAPANLRKEADPKTLNKINIDMKDLKRHILDEENGLNSPLKVSDSPDKAAAAIGVPTASAGVVTRATENESADDPVDSGSGDDDKKKDGGGSKDSDVVKVDLVYDKDDSDVVSVETEDDTDDGGKEKDDENKMPTELSDGNDDLAKREKDLDDKLDKIDKKKSDKEAKKESVASKYPFASMFNEENFDKFDGLCESSKVKVSDYLNSAVLLTPTFVNESWQNAFKEDATPVWLKYAPSNYRDAYDSAPQNIQDNLSESAQYVLFENQDDVDSFWENSGILSRMNNIITESYVRNVPVVRGQDSVEQLPYSSKIIDMVAESADDFR